MVLNGADELAMSPPAFICNVVVLTDVPVVCVMFPPAVRSVVVAVKLPVFKLLNAVRLKLVALSLLALSDPADASKVNVPLADELPRLTVPVLVSVTLASVPAVNVTLEASVFVIVIEPVLAVISNDCVLTAPPVCMIEPPADMSTDEDPLTVPFKLTLPVVAVRSTVAPLTEELSLKDNVLLAVRLALLEAVTDDELFKVMSLADMVTFVPDT